MDTMQSERGQRAMRWVVLPVLVYTLATVAITWPLAIRLASHAAGTGYSDTYEVVRHVWWAREALSEGHNPFDQPLLAYPDGFTSWVQWSHPLQYLPAALLAFIVSPLVAFNVVLMLTLVLNGMSAYWLGMALTGRNVAASLLGGLVFLAYPAVQGHLSVGHLGIVTLFPLPLFVLCLRRALRGESTWRTVIGGSVWFALAALAYVSNLVFVLAPFVVLYGGAQVASQRGRIWRRERAIGEQPWLRAGVMLALGAVLVVPFYAPLVTSDGQDEASDVSEAGRITFSTDALAFATPSPFGPLDDLGLVPAFARDVLGTNSAEGTAYLGAIALALALVAVASRREARGWLVVAVGAGVLSLGPLLKWRDAPVIVRVEDVQSYVTLPWLLLMKLPVIEATRTPGRFNLLTGLAMSALVSIGAAVALARIRRVELRSAVAVGLAVVVLAEYQLFSPFPTVDATMPGYFEALARTDGVRAVLDVPVDDNLVAKIGLYQQVFHHKPLIAGHALRRTPQDPALLAVLNRAVLGEADGVLPAIREADVPALLSYAGADRVIVHKQFIAEPEPVIDRLRGILGEPAFEDNRITVFAVPRQPAPAFELALAAGSAGWQGIANVGGEPVALLGNEADWHLVTAGGYGELVFRVAGYGTPHRIAVYLDGKLIAGLVAHDGVQRVPLWLEAGYHTLRFKALDGCDPYPFTPTCLAEEPFGAACERAEAALCLSAAFGTPTWAAQDRSPEAADISLEHGMRLRAFDRVLASDGSALRLRLFWEADHALPRSYALFVHVADPATGMPLAQADDFPAILTDHWDGGAQWVSDVQVALPADLPPGDYAVNVGWFDPESGQRLAVHGDRPWAADGILHLGTLRIE